MALKTKLGRPPKRPAPRRLGTAADRPPQRPGVTWTVWGQGLVLKQRQAARRWQEQAVAQWRRLLLLEAVAGGQHMVLAAARARAEALRRLQSCDERRELL
eukprot:2710311-Amphidinium_carterae.3